MHNKNSHKSTNNDDFQILFQVEEAIRVLKKGKVAEIDNIPNKLIKQGGQWQMVLTKIWQSGSFECTYEMQPPTLPELYYSSLSDQLDKWCSN